jgi:hypothetical protein
MSWQGIPDPVETLLERGFDAAGILYRRADTKKGRHIDFFLPELDIYVEVKRYHTPRTTEQMARVPDIIVIQGMKAAATFVKMIGGYRPRGRKNSLPLYHDIVEWNCSALG